MADLTKEQVIAARRERKKLAKLRKDQAWEIKRHWQMIEALRAIRRLLSKLKVSNYQTTACINMELFGKHRRHIDRLSR